MTVKLNRRRHSPPRLVQALIRQEIDPVTEIGTAATGFLFNELDVENCFLTPATNARAACNSATNKIARHHR